MNVKINKKCTIYINIILKNTFIKKYKLYNRIIIFKEFYEYYIVKFMNLNLYSI